MGGQVVPTHLMKRYVEQGLGRKEIHERLLQEHGLSISPNAISNFKRRYGYEPANQRTMPWALKPEHTQAYPAKLYRQYTRRERGGVLTKEAKWRLENWLRRLEASDAVLHYDPRTPQGFFYVARRPGVDTGIVRDPSVP